MPRTRSSGDGGLYPVRQHGCGRVAGEWKCGKARPSECPRAVITKWKGVVDIGFTADGRRLQKPVTAKTQSAARAKLESLKQEIKSAGSPLGNQTVAEWGAFWLEGYKRGKPQTYRTFRSLFNNWVAPHIGRKNVKDVRVSDLRRIYEALLAGPKPRTDATVLKVHNMLSSLFEGARLERLVATNVVKDIRAPKTAKVSKARDTFTQEETLRILEEAALLTDGSKWIMSLYAGIRQGERLGATIDSVDLDRDVFKVQWNLVEANYEHGCGETCGRRFAGDCPQRELVRPVGIEYRMLEGRLMLVPPKSGEPRTVPLRPHLADILRQHIERLEMLSNPHGLLWPARDGSPMNANKDQAEWKALLEAAKVTREGATSHWARHTAISDLTAAGVPERVTGEIVGHKSPGITGRYQHVASKDASDAMDKLGERRLLG